MNLHLSRDNYSQTPTLCQLDPVSNSAPEELASYGGFFSHKGALHTQERKCQRNKTLEILDPGSCQDPTLRSVCTALSLPLSRWGRC